MSATNLGFDPTEIATLQKEILATGNLFVLNPEELNNEEIAHFFFVGIHDGKPAIYDAVMYTLKLYHNGQLYEEAERQAMAEYPDFQPQEMELDQDGNPSMPDIPEEIQDYMSTVLVELEEDELVQVQEFVELDTEFEYGIGLEVALNVQELSAGVINNFVQQFNAGTLKLDDTAYSFQHDDETEEED